VQGCFRVVRTQSSSPNPPSIKNRTRPKTPRTKFQLYLKSPSSAVNKLLTPPVVGVVFVWDCLTLREGGCDLSAYLFHLPVLPIHLESFGQECECLPVNSAPVKPCQKSTTACLGSLGKDKHLRIQRPCCTRCPLHDLM